MNPNQIEPINKLSHFIKQFHNKELQNNYMPDSMESDTLWASSHLFAKLIYKSGKHKFLHKLEDWLEYKVSYEKRNDCIIDIDNLINNHWIRKTLGFIEIPGVIRSAANEVNRRKLHKDGILFLIETKAKLGSKIPISIFLDYLSEFEKKKGIEIGIEEIRKWHITKEENEEIHILNVHYYTPLLEKWNELNFIYEYTHSSNQENDIGTQVDKTIFEESYLEHSRLFINTPSIENLIAQKLIKESEYNTITVLQLHHPQSIHSKTSGIFWQLLCNDNLFNTDTERLRIWLQRTFLPHWPDINNYITEEFSLRFIDAAMELIKLDSDTLGVEDEIGKIKLDSRLVGDYTQLSNSIKHSGDELNNENLFDLLKSMDEVGEKWHDDIFQVQRVRYNLAFLIKQIVLLDNKNEYVEKTNERKYFPRIKELLRLGIDRPYLLWETAHFVAQNRPSVIPYLLVETDLSSLCFKIIDRVSFLQVNLEGNSDINIEVWKKSLDLSLYAFSSIDDAKQKAKFIFQVFNRLTQGKYNVHYSGGRQKSVEEFLFKEETKISIVLDVLLSYPRYTHSVYPANKEFFFPTILNELFQEFKSYKPDPKWQNGFIQLPIEQITGYSWLLKCLTLPDFQLQLKNSELPDKISEEFLSIYIERIQQTEEYKLNFETGEKELSPANWGEKNERLELVEWIYPVYHLNNTNRLNAFLSPVFSFKKTKAKYDDTNWFNAEKLRSHFGILLQILRALTSSNIDNNLNRNKIAEIKSKIEAKLVEYVRGYSVSNIKQAQIDIFEREYERSVFSYQLLPLLAQAINWFEEKEEIIKALADTSDLVRLLTIAEWITSESAKKLLVQKVKKAKIRDFLEKTYWIPEVESAMMRMIDYPELQSQVEETLKFWEAKISGPKNLPELIQATYNVKLLLAYKKNDENLLDQVSSPENNHIRTSTKFDKKEFFRGLIRLKSDPEAAYQIFNKLLTVQPNNTALALNRFACKISHGLKVKQPVILEEAINEWDNFESKIRDKGELDSIQINLWANKLIVYNELKKHEDFDKLYLTLEKPYRMLPNFLSIKIENLIERKLTASAQQLLKEARSYHQFSDGSEPDFIQKLSREIEGTDLIKDLKNNYNEIFSKSPETLIKIFPENLNGNEIIESFIVKEVAIAADKMLDKIQSIHEIRKEDKYSDLLLLALESRIIPWGWHATSQDRGAFSASGKGLGERDCTVKAKQDILAIIEMFNFKSKATVQSHLEKLFNYHHQRQFFIVLSYYMGKKGEFDTTWRKYANEIVPDIKYPTGFKMVGKNLTDVTTKFDYKNSAIKIGKAKHGKECLVYHLFVNINYRIH
ncbi:MAG: hypothetical protein WC150_13280 [Bacteroidia bacterium]